MIGRNSLPDLNPICVLLLVPVMVVMATIKAEEGVSSGLVICGTLEADDGYWKATRNVSLVVAEAKTQVWEEFCEAVEMDFQTSLASEEAKAVL